MTKINDPNGVMNQPSMKLYAEKGHKVTVTIMTSRKQKSF